MNNNQYDEQGNQQAIETANDQLYQEEQSQYNDAYSQEQISQYEQYYGGTSMEYNAEKITNYEQSYDANTYQDYYNAYYETNTNVADDKQQHKELYDYYLANLELMKSSFPKKRKIVRWEEEQQNYNSLDAADEFMDILGQMQENAEREQEITRKEQKEFEDIL